MYQRLLLPLLLLLSTTLLAQGSFHNLVEIDLCENWIRVSAPPAEVPNDTDYALLILQHGGATIFSNDNNSFGQLDEINGLGWYEDNETVSVVGDTLFLSRELQHDYATGDVTQVVLLPLQDELTLTDSTAIAFNGSQGGIIFLAARNKITIDGSLNADGAGYRGGAPILSLSQCNGLTSANDYYYSLGNWRAAPKGEGGAALIPGRELGRGPMLNGGGGGNDHNTGGGGGGHISRGGRGATNETPGLFTCNGNFPGVGGYALPDESDRLYFGGGGGAGHANNSQNNAGGNGGGIIYIISDTIVQTSNAAYSARGLDANLIAGDGGGAGGAGGTYALGANFLLGTTVITDLRGGDGGSIDNENLNQCMGPGGGGAGGRQLDIGIIGGDALPVTNLLAGSSGMNMNSQSCDDNENLAENGQNGLLSTTDRILVNYLAESLLNLAASADQNILCGNQTALLSFDYNDCLAVGWQVWNTDGSTTGLGAEATYSGQNSNQLSVSNLQVDTLRLVPGFVRGSQFFAANTVLVLTGGETPTAGFMVDATLPNNQASITDQSMGADSVYYLINGTGPFSGPDIVADLDFGNNTVLQIAVNDCGQDSLEEIVFLQAPSTFAAIASDPMTDTICGPATINFYNATTGPFDSVYWSFPGGDPGFSSADTVAVTYFNEGAFSAQLEVFGGVDGTFTSDQNFEIVLPPDANFTFNQVDNTVQVSPIGDDSDATYLWTYGDGGMSTDSLPPPYTYNEPGTYPVQLLLSNDCGSDSLTQFIVIQAPDAVAAIQSSGNVGCLPFSVELDDISTGVYDSLYWVLTGSSTPGGSTNSIIAVYDAPGNYEAVLELWRDGALNASTTVEITVVEPPFTSFSTEINGLELTTINSTVNADTYLWNFGDSNTSMEFQPTHTYDAAGNYTVTLNASNAVCGRSMSVEVSPVSSLADLTSAGLHLYPNPIGEEFYLEGQHRGLELYTIQGQLLQKWPANDRTGAENYPTSTLAGGTYLLRVNTPNHGIIVVRLIKN